MRIQHNIAAMNAYRNYNNNTSAVSSNLEKLSSGYKINRAGDDAAGLAISEKMRAQITGLKSASKNVKDGISLVKTAEGAMQEVQDMLNRMVSLATQSANGTYDNEVDRANLQAEVEQLKSEINRIADSANFNGINLLDGSKEIKTTYNLTNATSGAETGFKILKEGQLGVSAQAGKFSYDLSQLKLSTSGAVAGGKVTVTIGGISFSVSLSGLSVSNGTATGADLAGAIVTAFKTSATLSACTSFGGSTVTVSKNGSTLIIEMDQAPTAKWDRDMQLSISVSSMGMNTASSVGFNQGEQFMPTVDVEPIDNTQQRLYAQAEIDLSKLQIRDGTSIQIGKTTYTFAIGKDSGYKNAANVIDLTDKTLKQIQTSTGYAIAANRLSKVAANNNTFFVGSNALDGKVSLTEKEGAVDYSINNLAGEDGIAVSAAGTAASSLSFDVTDANWKGLVKFGQATVNGNGLTLQIGDTSDDFNQMTVSIGDIHTKALGVDGIDISTQGGAQSAVKTIRAAINQVSSIRGVLGATQNRLDHTSNNLSVMTENIQDAESTIRDTDVAEEMMAYTKNNILVQSAQAMLAQANQIPQGVLQLLG